MGSILYFLRLLLKCRFHVIIHLFLFGKGAWFIHILGNDFCWNKSIFIFLGYCSEGEGKSQQSLYRGHQDPGNL